MKGHLHRLWAGVLLLVTPLPSGLSAQEPLAGRLEGWLELERPGLVLVTDADAATGADVLERLQSLQFVLADLIPDRRLSEGVRILLFGSADSYEAFALEGRQAQFFAAPTGSLVVLSGALPPDELRRNATHEFVHAFFEGAGLRLPLWLGEGLADYYSTVVFEGDEAIIGAAVPGHIERLRGRAFLSIEALIEIESREPAYLEFDRAPRFYAQSWLTTHFLIAQRRRLGGLLEALDGGTDVFSAVVEALGGQGAGLDRQLRAYLNRPRLPTFSRPVRRSRETVVARRLTPADVALELGILATEQARWSGAPRRFALARALVERAPEGPGRDQAMARLDRLEGPR